MVKDSKLTGNETGKYLENAVEEALRQKGYFEYGDKTAQGKTEAFRNRHLLDGKQYIKQVHVGETLYGTKRKVDFFVISEKLSTNETTGLIIECKWQQSPGSVDEKFPYLLECIKKTAVGTYVVVDGKGCKPKAEEWLKEQVSYENHLFKVCSLVEITTEIFKKW